MKKNEIEQSDDCVSREFMYEQGATCIARRNDKGELIPIMAIYLLPPVTPTRKSGLHWIERFDNENKWLECPHCHKDSDNAYNYCPNCGASFKEENRGE